jgi:hypothetical protein
MGMTTQNVRVHRQGPWALPADIEKDAEAWVQALTFPRKWTSEQKQALKLQDSGNACRTLKASTYHVLLSCGALAEAANWPRALGEERAQRGVARLVGKYSELHRCLMLKSVVPEVRSKFSVPRRLVLYFMFTQCLLTVCMCFAYDVHTVSIWLVHGYLCASGERPHGVLC